MYSDIVIKGKGNVTCMVFISGRFITLEYKIRCTPLPINTMRWRHKCQVPSWRVVQIWHGKAAAVFFFWWRKMYTLHTYVYFDTIRTSLILRAVAASFSRKNTTAAVYRAVSKQAFLSPKFAHLPERGPHCLDIYNFCLVCIVANRSFSFTFSSIR